MENLLKQKLKLKGLAGDEKVHKSQCLLSTTIIGETLAYVFNFIRRKTIIKLPV